MTTLLEVKQLTKWFGGVQAVKEVSFSLKAGEVVAMIGPNGAGKTTVANVVAGQLMPDAGTMVLQGQAVQGKSPSRLARLGIARTFQNLVLFNDITVIENVAVAIRDISYGMFDALIRDARFHRRETEMFHRAEMLLDFVGLDPALWSLYPPMLSYGHRKLTELARALALKPKVLILDEPVAGMGQEEWPAVAEVLRSIASQGVAVLVIEHNLRFVESVGQSVLVMAEGRIIAEGTPAEVREHPDVIKNYLGRVEAGGAST